MIKFLNLDPEVFAIDINDLSLRIVKLRKKGAFFKMLSFREFPIPSGVVNEGVINDQEALARAIASACASVKGKKLDTKYVAVSLPEEKSFSQVISMIKMTPEELKTAVPYEAENYIPLPINNVYLDFQLIGQHNNDASHIDLLVNVMPKSIIDAYVNTLKKANLTLSILEIESSAIVRSLVKIGEKIPPTIFIDFGETKSSFIIFSGDSVRFTSSIPISSRQLTQVIAERFNIDLAQAEELKVTYGLTLVTEDRYDIKKIMQPILNNLILQMKKYMDFYQTHASRNYFVSEGSIKKIILCGGGANLKGLADFLFENLNIPVEIGNPLINLVMPKNPKKWLMPQEKALSFTTALGLALRAADYKNSEDGQLL